MKYNVCLAAVVCSKGMFLRRRGGVCQAAPDWLISSLTLTQADWQSHSPRDNVSVMDKMETLCHQHNLSGNLLPRLVPALAEEFSAKFPPDCQVCNAYKGKSVLRAGCETRIDAVNSTVTGGRVYITPWRRDGRGDHAGRQHTPRPLLVHVGLILARYLNLPV